MGTQFPDKEFLEFGRVVDTFELEVFDGDEPHTLGITPSVALFDGKITCDELTENQLFFRGVLMALPNQLIGYDELRRNYGYNQGQYQTSTMAKDVGAVRQDPTFEGYFVILGPSNAARRYALLTKKHDLLCLLDPASDEMDYEPPDEDRIRKLAAQAFRAGTLSREVLEISGYEDLIEEE